LLPPLVDAAWLRQHRAEVILADVRWYMDGRSAEDEYAAGHIPGAVFVSVDRDLAAPPDPARGRHPLPDSERFAAAMGALGIGDGDAVVAYDDGGGVVAARLVWMLRALGERAALLDGGLQAWPGPLEQERPQPRRDRQEPSGKRFTARAWPAERLATIDQVAAGGIVLIDARDRPRFLGQIEPIDPRPGHIPGARNVPARENLDSSGRMLPPERLRERFAAAGVRRGEDVVCYCGSGLTACHDLLALELAGLAVGRLYPGSWSQWSADRSRPAALGEE
jgi:thiosulfate/3-mercaptopyruvate sulfurtransferase